MSSLRARVPPLEEHPDPVPTRAWAHVWRRAAGALASVVSPADCRVCRGPLLVARRFAVCDSCLLRLSPESTAACRLCGERVDAEEERGVGFSRAAVLTCDACSVAPPAFARAVSYAAYDGMLRRLISLHKFEGRESLAHPLGSRLSEAMRSLAPVLAEGPVHLIAVPLFGDRRRFNQSVQLADVALRECRRGGWKQLVASHAALVRVRATKTQSQLTPAQRKENVRGAFAVKADVTGWQVLLIDDVYTTGATAEECTRTLLRAGAAGVHVVTLARTQWQLTASWDAEPGIVQ